MASIATIVRPGDPQAIVGPSLIPAFINGSWPLGTDRLGRDVLSNLLHGAQVTLLIAFMAAAATFSIGIIVGTVSGFMGGKIDEILMRFAEAFQTIPSFILALAIVGVLGSSTFSIVIGIMVGSWAGLARVLRAEILSIREREFVEADRAVGMHPVKIAFYEILPAALPAVLSMASIIIANAILIEAALSFLGLGDPNHVSWGKMIAEGRTVLRSAPYLSLIPGIAIVITVFAVNLIGDGIIEALNERQNLWRYDT